MRVFIVSFLATALAASTAMAAVPVSRDTSSVVELLTQDSHYGAPNPPGSSGSRPGWYYGDKPDSLERKGFHGLPWLKDKLICRLLKNLPFHIHCPKKPRHPEHPHHPHDPHHPDHPHHPHDPHHPDHPHHPHDPHHPHHPHDPPHDPPSDGWKTTFTNLTAAIQADGYLTFGLVDTVDDCKEMCSTVERCVFFNTYHDVNGKDGSPLLTCSLYDACHNADQATNTGGQTQPDGSVNFITNSDGYCHV